MAHMTLSVVTYGIAGYLLGLIIGFTVFDPNADIYALLGTVLAVVGLLIGLIPLFRRASGGVFGAVMGFYLGAVISVVLFGSIQADDLLEVLHRGGIGLIVAMISAVAGAFIGIRFLKPHLSLPALGLLLGGFLGGFVFFRLGIAPRSSLVLTAPFTLSSGLVIGAILWWLQRQRSARFAIQ